eukprot:TRINITY_DN1497_c0_g1_i14.p1 TRINITY_DN1497_c0_g1~~TRINITY_DN1497_c0_g1_i14.p1  ORF type:complete len:514 (+),score=85.27 TRINITY_DN1497_c0_g1_i14:747-2288(+)
MVNLQVLWIDQNRIARIPKEITNLTNLSELNFAKNKIPSLSTELCEMSALKTLYIDGNKIASLPNNFARLHLTNLNMSALSFTSLPLRLGSITSLQKLNLYGNELTSLPNTFSQLINLFWLTISKNMFTHIPEEIQYLTNLEVLVISGNQITEIPPFICQLTKLSRLDILYEGKHDIAQLPESISMLPCYNQPEIRELDRMLAATRRGNRPHGATKEVHLLDGDNFKDRGYLPLEIRSLILPETPFIKEHSSIHTTQGVTIYHGRYGGMDISLHTINDHSINDIFREVLLCKVLRHNNLVSIIGLIPSSGNCAVITESLPQSLEQVIDPNSSLDIRTSYSYARQLADLLQHLLRHEDEALLSWKDIDSGNIFVSDNKVKLLRLSSTSKYQQITSTDIPQEENQVSFPSSGAVRSTVQELDAKTPDEHLEDCDVHCVFLALGIVLYKIATRLVPYPGKSFHESMVLLKKQLYAQIPADIPDGFSVALSECWKPIERDNQAALCSLDTIKDCFMD